MCRTCLTIVLPMIVIGCGGGDTPELGTVYGTVTLDGKALPNATVTFSPMGKEGGQECSAVTQDDGSYELKYSAAHAGAPPGKYEVRITTATTTTDESGNDVEVPEKLPSKYNYETELKREVEAGSNKMDFDLDSEGTIHKEKDDEGNDESSPGCS